jgi:hypothetical protein
MFLTRADTEIQRRLKLDKDINFNVLMADMFANNYINGSCLLIDRFNLLIRGLDSGSVDADTLR